MLVTYITSSLVIIYLNSPINNLKTFEKLPNYKKTSHARAHNKLIVLAPPPVQFLWIQNAACGAKVQISFEIIPLLVKKYLCQNTTHSVII